MPQAILNMLIADDDDGDRKQIRRVLQQSELSCNCTEARSVGEALEACERNAFDCAILDYQLPGTDGLDGISALHERLPYMPLIMVTGQGDETVATEAMKRGASDYMRKKFVTSQSIRSSIENAIEKKALLRTVARQREELETFSQVLVHDLRAPIYSLLVFVALIEEGIHQGKTEEISLYCGPLTRAVKRMNSLIDTLYRYTTAERVLLEPVEMNQLMIDTIAGLDPLIKERRARVTYDELPVVSGTPQLAQLMQNLLSNGIKYCEAEFPVVHVSARSQPGNIWLFSVQDNGIGIPAQQCQLIFEAFHRLHGVGKYEGTGLGLATCKKIVERHGGTISCTSIEGSGSTFSFTLNGAKL